MDKKVALITGSTSGIGLGIAQRLGKSGCDVIITGLADEQKIEQILETLNSSFSGKFTYIGGNLMNEDAIQKLCCEVIENYPGGIDILINNAGVNHPAYTNEYPVHKWHELVAVNLTAPFLLTRYFLPYMKTKGWGRIVNISSMMGMISLPGRAPYSATKAGLIAMTKGVALECAEFGITCNAVCPGFVFTEILRNLIDDTAMAKSLSFEEAKNEFFLERNPTQAPITVEQVAEMVAYLCSDEAASSTGSALTIDAGFTAK